MLIPKPVEMEPILLYKEEISHSCSLWFCSLLTEQNGIPEEKYGVDG